jgi:hypothetical protein
MTDTTTREDQVARLEREKLDLIGKLSAERRRALTAEAESERFRQVMSDDPELVASAASWLQWKNARQRVALHRLTRRVTAQRAVLRRLAETGREPTDEDWEVIRTSIAADLEDALAEVGLPRS